MKRWTKTTSVPSPAPSAKSPPTMRPSKRFTEYAALFSIWIALLLLFGALSDKFLSARTFTTLANRIPTLTVVAAGMTLVLIIGGIDLSVGSVLGLAGALLGVAIIAWHWPLWAAAALSLGCGL